MKIGDIVLVHQPAGNISETGSDYDMGISTSVEESVNKDTIIKCHKEGIEVENGIWEYSINITFFEWEEISIFKGIPHLKKVW